MTIDFVRGSNPVWYLVDLFGKQFDDTFWLYVLDNEIPYNFSAPFHDPSGTIPWTDPIQFLANGTLPVDIYFDDTKVYRLEFRQNVGPLPPSQDDPLIYLVENYVPSGAGIAPPNIAGSTTDNQIANGQFAEFNFTTPFNLAAAVNPPAIEIAPGWFLDLTGTGNVTIERIPLTTAVITPTNAPYALHININGGWTGTPVLRQRFQQNGQNWQGKFISTSFTARIIGAQQIITARLDASNNQPIVVLEAAFLTGNFVEYQGVAQVPMFTNLDVPPDSYIDYKILLPQTIEFYITSIQLTESSSNATVSYQEDTVDRQIDHLFHYYKHPLEYKQIPSYLVGWDFPLNPSQTNGDNVAVQATAVNQGYYAWDQTIIYQTVASSVAVSRAPNGGMLITGAIAGQVAIIQYLDQVEARKILSDRASVNLNLFGSIAAGATGNVTLWATTDVNLPTLPNTFITALGANGIPTTLSSANWVQVPNVFQQTSFTVPAISATNSEFNDIQLKGWNLAGAVPSNTATYFAIVVGFTSIGVLDTLNINSISLCAGDIPTRPAPKTLGETLLDCQPYFWSTFPVNTKPQTALGINSGFPTVQRLILGNSGTNLESDLPTPQRTQSTVTYYNPVNNNALAYNIIRGGDCTTTQIFLGGANDRRKVLITSIADNNGGGAAFTDVYGVHITSDARLGVVN